MFIERFNSFSIQSFFVEFWELKRHEVPCSSDVNLPDHSVQRRQVLKSYQESKHLDCWSLEADHVIWQLNMFVKWTKMRVELEKQHIMSKFDDTRNTEKQRLTFRDRHLLFQFA